MGCHLLSLFQSSAVVQVVRYSRGPEAVTSDLRLDTRFFGLAPDHPPNISGEHGILRKTIRVTSGRSESK
jgi:hypothetical protein